MVLCICSDTFVGCRANNQNHSAPTGGAGGESPNNMNSVVDANSNDVGLPAGHADDCICGITGVSNDYFNSDQHDNMDHFQANHQLGAKSLNMVEAFAGVGAFGNGWRKLGTKVIGLFEWDDSLSDLLLHNDPNDIFDFDFYKLDFNE